jgi:hypothetical protein
MNNLQKLMGEISAAAAIAEAGDESGALAKAKTAYLAYRAQAVAFASAEVEPALRAQQLLFDLEDALRMQSSTFGDRGQRLAQALGDRVRRDARSPRKLFKSDATTIAAEDLNASNDE